MRDVKRIVLVLMVVWVGFGSVCSAGTNGGQVIHFPEERSLGMLKIQDAATVRQIESFHHWVDGADWAEYLGEAMGDVTIPAGKRLALFVSKAAWRDLSPLSALGPNDLYMLRLPGSVSESVKPDDRCMQHITGLTGLKVLNLHWTNISSKGLEHIKNFKKLERLYLPERTTNKSLTYIAELHLLKGLYFKGNRVTNAGLKYLAKLKLLEELELGGKRIGDVGLIHLAKLPKLRYLLLWGEGFSDAGMVHLRDVPSLKILHLGRLPITDAGLAHLSNLTELENLNLYNTKVTDEGLIHLKPIRTLKKLGLSDTQVTGNGLVHLAEIKSLEYLDLPSESVTDKGLIYLAKLSKLKHLRMPSPHYVEPNMDKRLYTDEGLKELTKLRSLEELFIAGLGVTDVGIEHIAELTNLKKLNLFGCPITDRGLTHLRKLKGLEDIYLYKSKVTMSGLSVLNGLTNLRRLNVKPVIQDYSGLDISGLTKLEKLTIGTPHRSGTTIRDEDLACLANLKNLRWFQVSGVITKPHGLTDAGVAHLRGLTNMDRLTIGGPELTDKALSYLKDMKKLNMLNVYGGNFTNEGLAHLKGLKSLRSIRLAGTHRFSPTAIRRFKRELPNLYSFKTDLRDFGFEGAEAKLSGKSKK